MPQVYPEGAHHRYRVDPGVLVEAAVFDRDDRMPHVGRDLVVWHVAGVPLAQLAVYQRWNHADLSLEWRRNH